MEIVMGTIGINQITANANEVVLKASTALIGKVSSDALASFAAMTRPNNATPYTAGDVVGTDVATNMTFSNVVSVAAAMVLITNVLFRIDVAAIPAGMATFKLHLFSSAPTAIIDNAAWTLIDADRAKYLGYILLDTPIDVGGTLFSQTLQANFILKLAAASTSLYGQLQTVGGYTPTAVAVKTISLNTIVM